MKEKEVYESMVKSGAMDPTEVPFDEDENSAPETEADLTLPQTLVLKFPVEFNGQQIKELVFKNYPTAGVCLHLKIGFLLEYQYGHFVPIVSHCCGMPDVLVKKLCFSDFKSAVDLVLPFLFGSGE